MGWFFGKRKTTDTMWDSMSSISRMISGFNATAKPFHQDGKPASFIATTTKCHF